MRAAYMMGVVVAVGLVLGQGASGGMLLVADGDTFLLGGEHTFDAVEIYGTLQLTGDTELTVLDTFLLGPTGRVNGAGTAGANGANGSNGDDGQPTPDAPDPKPGWAGGYGVSPSPAPAGRRFTVRVWNDLTVLGTVNVPGGHGGAGGTGGNGGNGGDNANSIGGTGGAGGSGGGGGTAGDGGDVLLASRLGTLVFGATARVNSTGGRGGAGGTGGRGGDGGGTGWDQGRAGRGGSGGQGGDGGSGGLVVLMAPHHDIDPLAVFAYGGGGGGTYGKYGLTGYSFVNWRRPVHAPDGVSGFGGPGGDLQIIETPEPATLSLLAVGGLWALRRRRGHVKRVGPRAF